MEVRYATQLREYLGGLILGSAGLGWGNGPGIRRTGQGGDENACRASGVIADVDGCCDGAGCRVTDADLLAMALGRLGVWLGLGWLVSALGRLGCQHRLLPTLGLGIWLGRLGWLGRLVPTLGLGLGLLVVASLCVKL